MVYSISATQSIAKISGEMRIET